LVSAVALLLVAPFVAHDVAVNGFGKAEKRQQLREQHAAEGFKPSQLASSEAHFGLSPRAQGMSPADLFREWHWFKVSFRSFTGVYGRMDIFGKTGYYQAQTVLYLVLCVGAMMALWRNVSRKNVLLLGAGLLFAVLTVFQSFCRSWVHDYQAQGRYLFPVIPILLLTWRGVMGPRKSQLAVVLCLVFFMLGTYSFLFVGLARLLE
jgi:hypothetical protein